MAWFIGQSLVIIIIAAAVGFVLGLLLGWILWHRTRTETGAAMVPRADLDKRDKELAAARKDLATRTGELEECRSARTGTDPATEAPASRESEITALRDELDTRERELATARADLDLRTRELDECRAAGPATQPVSGFTGPVGGGPGTTETIPEPATDKIPEPVTETLPEAPDDIERIEGIGPKIGAALRAAGLHTFARIADATDAQLRQATEAGGVRFAPSMATWQRQARLLADGDEPGFEAFAARLTAGRDRG